MHETLLMVLWWHGYGALVLGAMVVIYAILVLSGNGDKQHRWRIRLFLPAYYTVMAIVVFSGFVAWAIARFEASFAVWAMICGWVVLVVLGIIGFKKLKMGGEFKRFLLLKASVELAIIGILAVI